MSHLYQPKKITEVSLNIHVETNLFNTCGNNFNTFLKYLLKRPTIEPAWLSLFETLFHGLLVNIDKLISILFWLIMVNADVFKLNLPVTDDKIKFEIFLQTKTTKLNL